MKIGRNDPCPCFIGVKYKNCKICYEKIDWAKIIANDDYISYFSIRGKNIFFMQKVCEILQLDAIKHPELSVLKKALRDKEKIRAIHETVSRLWPSAHDLRRILQNEIGNHAALYTGEYGSDKLYEAMCRHSLYTDRILLIDPFIYPGSVRPEFDPVENPSVFANDTLRKLDIWFSLFPWIASGIVGFIRSPTDFDSMLRFQSLAYCQVLGQNPIIKASIEAEVAQMSEERKDNEWLSYAFNYPSEHYKEIAKQCNPEMPDNELDKIVEHFIYMQKNSPYIVDPIGHGNPKQIETVTSGTDIYTSKIIANASGAHLVTSMQSRWKMIEIERKNDRVDDSAWEPFAKCIQEAKLSALNTTSLPFALRLREENRLEGMRSFLRKVWSSNASADFSSRQTEEFATELTEQIAIAKEEWDKLDQELWKFASYEAALTVGGQIIQQVNWAWAGLAYSGMIGANLVYDKLKRASVRNRYPASLFVGA